MTTEAGSAAPRPPASEPTRAGFVAVVGPTNAGKSTLVNRLVGGKVSIVSKKPQTTRTRVLGICMRGPTQIILVDTPGIFRPRRRLDRAMVAAAWAGAAEADQVVLLVDAKRGLDEDARAVVERLKAGGRTAILALNKIDLVLRPMLLALADEINRAGRFSATFMISAATGDGVEDLVAHVAGALPEGPWLYPPEQMTDVPDRVLAAEITREQVFHQLHQELPYASAVETEGWEERADGSLRIEQMILVERASQKAIVLGRGGQRIKAIGTAARAELEAIFGCRVHLFLHVKVEERWGEDRARFRDLGLDFDA
ncbi:MAG: GTPase Era [Proteobacteria bacterium]|nr:GTPase Era [Pseudomonadota bacterium]